MREQEVRDLYEAYRQVHQIDEVKYSTSSQDAKIPDFENEKKAKPVPGLRVNKPPVEEEVDIYDIIRSHLLESGYAETPEAAEAIMVSMSEDWRESLISEYFSIGGPSVGGGGGSRGPSERQRRGQERERRGHELRSRARRVVDRQRKGSHGEADSQMSAQPDRKRDYDPNSGWAHYYDDSARGRATALRPRG